MEVRFSDDTPNGLLLDIAIDVAAVAAEIGMFGYSNTTRRFSNDVMASDTEDRFAKRRDSKTSHEAWVGLRELRF